MPAQPRPVSLEVNALADGAAGPSPRSTPAPRLPRTHLTHLSQARVGLIGAMPARRVEQEVAWTGGGGEALGLRRQADLASKLALPVAVWSPLDFLNLGFLLCKMELRASTS